MQDQTSLRLWAGRYVARHRDGLKRAEGADIKPSVFNIEVALKDGGGLLFNSRRRSLCRLSKTELEAFRQWSEADRSLRSAPRLDPMLMRTLTTDGFVVSGNSDELSAVEREYNAARGDRQSLMLTIAPTMACNLACGYCFQGLNKDNGKLDPRVPDAIVDFVRAQAMTLKSLNVTWYGGEPLMARSALYKLADQLMALCEKGGISYSSMIVTNGYFLTVDVARQLLERRCGTAQVTVDGLKETHDRMRPMTSGRGSFDRLMTNLEAVLEETALNVSLRVNVGRRNIDECAALLDDFQRRGFGRNGRFHAYFAPIDAATAESGSAWEEGLSKQEYNERVLALGARARELGFAGTISAPAGFMGMCVAAKENGYVITQNGDVHKCWETAHDPDKRVGSILAPGQLDDSHNGALWRSWTPFDSETCRSCKILPMCGGHCAHRFIYTGAGNEEALPCPEWKWNTAEYLFSRAKDLGVVEADDWCADQSTVLAKQSGERQSTPSLRLSQARTLAKANAARGEAITVDRLLQGESAQGAADGSAAGPQAAE